MYKVDSPDAVDFINHQEIIETLEYAAPIGMTGNLSEIQ